MKKIIFISLFVSLALVFSVQPDNLAQAQTSPSPTVEDLQKQIQLLLGQIGSLQKEVTSLKSPTPTSPPTTAPTPTLVSPVQPTSPEIDESTVSGTENALVAPPTLTRSLFRGSRGDDVRQLQEFLSQDPSIYPEGTASGYYGVGTEAAVKKWQAKNGIPAVGVVGRQTIAKFKEISGTTVFPRPTVPTDTTSVRPNSCPVYAYMPVCKEGQSSYDANSCQVCQIQKTDTTKKEICPALPTVDSCLAGEERVVTYKSAQCGVYYACKPRASTKADNTSAVLKKVSAIQTDNRYNLVLNDPEGIQKFSVYNTKGSEISSGYPACRTEYSSPVIGAESSEFPLKLTLADCGNPSSLFSTALTTPVVVKPISEGLNFPYKFSNGKTVYSGEEARSYCYANGPGSGQGLAGECETKFGVVYTTTTTTSPSSGRAIYSSTTFESCMTKYGFAADAKQIKVWAGAADAIPWSNLTSASQNTVTACEREYYGQQTVETGAAMCTDGKDNDGDGFIDAADPSCAGYTTTTQTTTTTATYPSGQKNQIWNSLGLSSSIRTDADSARIEQLKSACANVHTGANIWTPNAGTSSSVDFGMPSADKCRLASACTASQYFDGAACVNNSSTTTNTYCPSGQYWSGASCLVNPSGSGASTCTNGQWWNGSACVSSTSSSSCGSSPSTCTTESQCTAVNFFWYDGSCHSSSPYSASTWPTDQASCSSRGYSWCAGSSGVSSWCQAGTCPSSTSSSSSSCPSGQYWSGSSCVTSSTTTCSGGQWWNGSACVSSTSSGSGSGSGGTACSSGQYWNGSSCVTSTSSGGTSTGSGSGGTACSGGQWWNGTACVNTSTTNCTSGQYWNGTACVSSTPSASVYDQMKDQLKSMEIILRGLLGK